MEKILKIETLILSGKFVDEEQKVTYTTKTSVEKSLADLKGIQTALEEVAKEEQDKADSGQSSSSQLGSSEETKDYDPAASPVEFPLSEKRVAEESRSSEVVGKLLKTVQVIHRFEAVVSKPLPADVSALSQALAGNLSDAQVAFQGLLEVSVCWYDVLFVRVVYCREGLLALALGYPLRLAAESVRVVDLLFLRASQRSIALLRHMTHRLVGHSHERVRLDEAVFAESCCW